MVTFFSRESKENNWNFPSWKWEFDGTNVSFFWGGSGDNAFRSRGKLYYMDWVCGETFLSVVNAGGVFV